MAARQSSIMACRASAHRWSTAWPEPTCFREMEWSSGRGFQGLTRTKFHTLVSFGACQWEEVREMEVCRTVFES